MAIITQGVSDEFIPEIVQLQQLDKVIAINDGDAILMAQKLANRLGVWRWGFLPGVTSWQP